jgi:hypothetical protein
MSSIGQTSRRVQPNGKILEKFFGDTGNSKEAKGKQGLPKCGTDWTLGI